jgi:hypothetical protein
MSNKKYIKMYVSEEEPSSETSIFIYFIFYILFTIKTMDSVLETSGSQDYLCLHTWLTEVTPKNHKMTFIICVIKSRHQKCFCINN